MLRFLVRNSMFICASSLITPLQSLRSPPPATDGGEGNYRSKTNRIWYVTHYPNHHPYQASLQGQPISHESPNNYGKATRNLTCTHLIIPLSTVPTLRPPPVLYHPTVTSRPNIRTSTPALYLSLPPDRSCWFVHGTCRIGAGRHGAPYCTSPTSGYPSFSPFQSLFSQAVRVSDEPLGFVPSRRLLERFDRLSRE